MCEKTSIIVVGGLKRERIILNIKNYRRFILIDECKNCNISKVNVNTNKMKRYFLLYLQ